MLDPAAFTGLGGLEEIRERVAHVHVKDVSAAGDWVQIGDGIVDFAAMLRHLGRIRMEEKTRITSPLIRTGASTGPEAQDA